jgi:transketolase
VGIDGGIVAMSSYGESAPAGELFKHFGFTVENVVDTINKVLD